MTPHVRNYLSHFGYDESSFIACEVCGAKSTQIHHLVPRSKFGKKMKYLQDMPGNLVALCTHHHDIVHSRGGGRELNNIIKEIVLKRR